MKKIKKHISNPENRKFDKDKIKQEMLNNISEPVKLKDPKNTPAIQNNEQTKKIKKLVKHTQHHFDKKERNQADPYQNFGESKNIKKLAKKMLKAQPENVSNLKTQIQTLKRLQKLPNTEVRLNRYIAHCGICARREADTLIKSGKIKVNGEVVKELGKKINVKTDIVEYEGKKIEPKKFVYILMNKPKDCLCTVKDPQGRRTVLDIVEGVTPDRVFPVGRLDRNTIGVLLLTNDGELAQRLMHPSYQVPKIYQVTLTEPLQRADMEAIKKGITLDDGLVQVDDIEYVPNSYRKQVIIQIHSGRNRVIRRLFEYLDYQIEKLDRIMYAGLTKKAVPRGKFRFLDESEIEALRKMVGLN
ncbi:MAG: rRNA pseudouridine synthase [Bacteroidia bacterium]|nr:rRNA pseudouridine synthase [Bacteroidia bacterium]MDW8346039.1 pseudouridine synthase [Bacteroidia bacterium]